MCAGRHLLAGGGGGGKDPLSSKHVIPFSVYR